MRSLELADVKAASKLDKKWFSVYGISAEELGDFINQYPNNSIAVSHEGELTGFATFEILEQNDPKNYVEITPPKDKVFFIQQFTTLTNYAIKDMSSDEELLRDVEQKAQELGCQEIWEALAVTHPYSHTQNTDFDAFGFYESHGYVYEKTATVSWSPSADISIPCYLFKKHVYEQ